MSGRESNAVVVYRRLLPYLRPHWLLVVAAFVPAVIYSLLGAVVPVLLSQWIEALRDAVAERAWQIPLLIAVLFPIRSAMDFLMVYGLAWVGRSVIRDLRGEVFGHYLTLPARYFDQGSSGVLISRLTYNTEQVAEAVSTAIVIALRDTIAILALLAMMISMSPRLTLLIGVVAPVIVLVVGAMSRALRRYSTRIQHSMGDVTKLTEQSLHGHRVVKVFEGQEHERRQFKDVNTRNFRLHVRLVAVQALGDGLTQYAVALGVAAVMYFSFSDLDEAAFLGFVSAMAMLLAPLKRLININTVVQRGIAAGASLFEILDQPGRSRYGNEDPRAGARRRRVSRRVVPLRRNQRPCAAQHEPRSAGGNDGCARRPVGQRQIDVG